MRYLKVLGLDFETQGKEAETTNVTEVGAVLVELEIFANRNGLPERREIERYCDLVYDPSYPPQTQEIVELTGISDRDLRERGRAPLPAMAKVRELVAMADIVMAHNKLFDETVYNSQVKKLSLEPLSREWICTYQDVPYPQKFTCKKLSHLALDHGVRMDHRKLHRADNDVELMLDLVLGCYHIDDILAYAREPWSILKADILGPWVGKGGDGGVGKEQATALGYSWENVRGTNENFPKCWVKRVKRGKVEQEKLAAPFRVSVLR